MSRFTRRPAQGDSNDLDDFEIEITNYHGHPTLTFFGPFTWFRLGARKVRTILEHADECQEVLESLGLWRE